MAKPWVEEVLRRHEVRDLFDSLVISSELERPKPHPRGYHHCVESAEGEVVMVSDEFNEDLLMAQCVGMTTIWIEDADEEPYRQPDYIIGDFASVPSVLGKIQS